MPFGRLVFAGMQFETDRRTAVSVVQYARLLFERGAVATVTVPILLEDGRAAAMRLLLGRAPQIAVLVDAAAAAFDDLPARIAELEPVAILAGAGAEEIAAWPFDEWDL